PSAVDRPLYLSYLHSRLRTIKPATPLATGLSYRLFKELVNTGDYARAERHRASLLVEIARRFQIDLSDFRSINFDGLDRLSLWAFGSRVPFCITGCLY